MGVKIIIDSASDMLKSDADSKGLLFVPLKTHFPDGDFLDGVTISHQEFYAKLAASKALPTTSQPTPFDFETLYQQVKAQGDEALVITLSGKLSGTIQSAKIAAEEYQDCVTIVDSETVTVAEQILVEDAIRLRDAGLSAKEIAVALEQDKKRLCVLGVIDTLEYLVKGGRLSKAAGIAGGLLGIKPVLTIRDGELVVLGKARGLKQSNNFLNTAIAERGGIDFSMPYRLGYSGSDRAALENYIESSRSIWEPYTDCLPVSSIGSTIGTHTGPGLIGVAFFSNK